MRSSLIVIIVGTAIGALIATNAADKFKKHTEKQLHNKNNDSRTLIKLDLASAFSETILSNSSLNPKLIEQLKRVSNSGILIKFQRPETSIPLGNLFDAVSSGVIDTALSSSHLWTKKSPALNFSAQYILAET